jgi:hypothetical protein
MGSFSGYLCGAIFIGSLLFIGYERNRFNVLSRKEVLAIREQLKVLSREEKKDLAYFINQVISFDQFSYTLIGYKPMSIANVIVEDTEDLSPFWREAFKTSNQQRLRSGYLVWKKYQSFFSKKNHLFVDYTFLGIGRREIALICPKLCMAVIQEHLPDFQEILGKPYTTEEVFLILTHPEHTEFYKIIDNTRLIGILLGFGRNNAYFYERYRGGVSRSNMTRNQRLAQDTLQMFSSQWPLPWRQLSPDFICDPVSEETRKLKDHYKAASKKVWWTYFLRNNLEVTLALLAHISEY